MRSTKDILAEMGVQLEAPDPDEIRIKAQALGLVMSEEELSTYSSEIRRMSESAGGCASCTALESCAVEPTGYEYIFHRSEHGHPYFAMRPCARRVQYEELLRSERLLASSRIPAFLRSKTFKVFDTSENKPAARVAAEIVKDQNRKGAIFYGPTGVGKTHLAVAILNHRIVSGATGIYATVPELMDDLRSAMRNNTIEEARQAIVDTDLLFLDDIGAENPTEFVVEELFKIVNGRLLRGRQIIGTTNLSPESFKERYAGLGGTRIYSRLNEACEWVEMIGRDRRV